MEIDLLVVQMLFSGGEREFGFRKEDKKVFNLGVKEIKRDPNKEDKKDYVWPLDRHKQYSHEFFIIFFQM